MKLIKTQIIFQFIGNRRLIAFYCYVFCWFSIFFVNCTRRSPLAWKRHCDEKPTQKYVIKISEICSVAFKLITFVCHPNDRIFILLKISIKIHYSITSIYNKLQFSSQKSDWNDGICLKQKKYSAIKLSLTVEQLIRENLCWKCIVLHKCAWSMEMVWILNFCAATLNI